MKNVDINLGWACNNACLFCSNGQTSPAQRKWGDQDEIKTEIITRRKQGAESIGFLGGEPTIYPNLKELISLAKQHAYKRISICTNGRKLAADGFLMELIEAGLTRVALSIHSHKPFLEDQITGREGSFEQKMNAISNLVAARDKGLLPDGFSLNVVLHGKNINDLVEFSRFVAERSVTDVRFNFIRPAYKALHSKIWIPLLSTVTPKLLSVIAENESRLFLMMTFADLPLCKFPWQVLVSDKLRYKYIGENWDLTTEVTQHRPLQDSEQITNRFNWKQQRQEKLKSYPEACKNCPWKASKCEGVWLGYLDLYGNTEFSGSAAMVRASISHN